VFTPTEAFESWLQETDEVKDQPGEAESRESSMIVASNSPIGLVDAAITLIEHGSGDQERLQPLIELRQKLKDKSTEDVVLEYFDTIVAAGATFQNSDGKFVSKGLDQDAAMIVAMALSGSQQASELLKSRQSLLEEYRVADDNRHRQTVEEFRLPGESVSDEELKLLRESGLVAVHTTPADPRQAQGEGRTISTTGDFLVDTDQHWPRAFNTLELKPRRRFAYIR
jgi:hypothetical protein